MASHHPLPGRLTCAPILLDTEALPAGEPCVLACRMPLPSQRTLSGLRWWPFIILAGTGLAVWSSGPKPSGMGPLGGVRVVILVSGLVLAIFLEVMARMMESRERLAKGYDASPEAARAILDTTAGLTRVLNLALAVFMALL